MFLIVICLSGIFMLTELMGINKVLSWYFAFIPFLTLFAMLGFNRWNRDYPFYEKMFSDEVYRNEYNFGYASLVDFVVWLGLDHRAIVFLIGMLLCITLLRYLKNNNHVNLVIFFYSAYPLIYDINQTRNTLMYLIVLLSLGYVVKKKPIKFYFMWLISLSIHSFALVYLPFYYFSKLDRKKFMKYIRILTIVIAISSPLVLNVASILFPEKMGIYLSRRPDFGIIVFFTYAAIEYFTVWWVDKRVSSRLKEEDKPKMEVLYRFVWFPVLILPFQIYFFEIFRMQRNAILAKYIYCALAMRYMTIKEKIFTVFLLFISVIVYISVLWYGSELELYEFLNENSIKYYLDKYFF